MSYHSSMSLAAFDPSYSPHAGIVCAAHACHRPARRVLELIDGRAKAVIAGQVVRVQLPVPLNGAPTIAVVLPANGDPVIHMAGSKQQIRLAMDVLNSTVKL